MRNLKRVRIKYVASIFVALTLWCSIASGEVTSREKMVLPPYTPAGISVNKRDIPIGIAIKAVPLAVEQYSNLEDQRRFLEGYSAGYKFALIKMEKLNYTTSLDKNEPYGKGYFSGESQGFEDIKNNIWRCSFIDFDYNTVELVGKFKFAFEQSEFISSDGKVCWVDGNESVIREIPQNSKVRASGYLSQEGIYGHLGGYHYEFIVINIKTTDNSEKNNITSPVPKVKEQFK